MRTKKTAGAQIFAAAVTAALLLSGCNDFTEHDTIPQAKVTSVSLQTDVFGHADTAAGFDATKIRSVNIYDYWCEDGWANMPAKITFYTRANNEFGEMDDGVSFSEDLPFDEFKVDAFGTSLEWTATDTGNYSGSPKTLRLKRSTDLSGVAVMSFYYTLEVDAPKENGGGIQITFVDKDGNESASAYLDTYTLRK